MWKSAVGHNVKVEVEKDGDDWETDPDFVVSNHFFVWPDWPRMFSEGRFRHWRALSVLSLYPKCLYISGLTVGPFPIVIRESGLKLPKLVSVSTTTMFGKNIPSLSAFKEPQVSISPHWLIALSGRIYQGSLVGQSIGWWWRSTFAYLFTHKLNA